MPQHVSFIPVSVRAVKLSNELSVFVRGTCGLFSEIHYRGKAECWPDIPLGTRCTASLRLEAPNCVVLDNLSLFHASISDQIQDQVLNVTPPLPPLIPFDSLFQVTPAVGRVNLCVTVQRKYSYSKSKKGSGRKHATFQFHGTLSGCPPSLARIPLKAFADCAKYLNDELLTSSLPSVPAVLLNVLLCTFGKKHELQVHFDRRSHFLSHGSDLFDPIMAGLETPSITDVAPPSKRCKTD